jgi:hypothetical protein
MKPIILTITLLLSSSLLALAPRSAPLKSPGYLQDDQSCWGSDKRCSDGKYYGPGGEAQPDTCAVHEGDTHPCECQRAKVCNGGGPNGAQVPGAKCKTYCRDKSCSCVTPDCS